MVLLDQGGAARHGRLTLTPAPPDLRGLVQHIVMQTHPGGAREWRVVPDLSPHLIARVTDDGNGRRLSVGFVGARSVAAEFDVSTRVITVGLRLRPGTLGALTSIGAVELADRALPLEQVFGRRLLRDLELSVDTPPPVLAAELLRLVRRAAARQEPHRIAGQIERASRVRGLADTLTMPERTLRERAAREIGLRPKLSMRIARLHRALLLARTRTRSAVAHEAGFADQAHLTRECRALLGETPGEWLRRGLPIRSRRPI